MANDDRSSERFATKIAVLETELRGFSDKIKDLKDEIYETQGKVNENSASIAVIMTKSDNLLVNITELLDKVQKLWEWQIGKDRDYTGMVSALEKLQAEAKELRDTSRTSFDTAQHLSKVGTLEIDFASLKESVTAINNWVETQKSKSRKRSGVATGVGTHVLSFVATATITLVASALINFYGCHAQAEKSKSEEPKIIIPHQE